MTWQIFDEETKKCLRDKNWRMDNLYSINDKLSQLVPFRRNLYQQQFNTQKHWRDIILKSRQLGMTTDCVVDAFDEVVWTPNFYCMFISHLKRESDAILKNKLPVLWSNYKVKNFMKYKVLVDQAWEFRVGFDEKNDSISSYIRAGTSGTSGTYNYMHISELAPMEEAEKGRADDVIRGTGSVPYDGKIVIESTARWDFWTFHDMFVEAWDKTKSWHKLLPTEYKAHFFNWFNDPEIQMVKETIPVHEMKNRDLFEQTMRDNNLSLKAINWWYSKFAQFNYDLNKLFSEYPRTVADAFRASGDPYFNQELLDMHPTRQPIAVQGSWKFYAKREFHHVYSIWGDPAGGNWGNNAAIVITDLTVGEVVAEYCNKFTPPEELGNILHKYGTLYNNAVVCVELNNHGHAVILQLKHLKYVNIYTRIANDKHDDTEKEELWFVTDWRSKPAILSALSLAVNTFALRISSPDIKLELNRYPRKESEVVQSDTDGNHWDRVMATALSWEWRKQAPISLWPLEVSG